MKKVLINKWCRRCKKEIEAHHAVCPFCQDFLLEGKTKKEDLVKRWICTIHNQMGENYPINSCTECENIRRIVREEIKEAKERLLI